MPGQAIVTITGKQRLTWQWQQVFLATTYAELTIGLSGQPSLPPETGMLLVLPTQQVATIHMTGMLFPLDIVFISSQLEVVSLVSLEPEDPPVSQTAKYILEVNAGEAEGVEPGDNVSIYGVEPAAMATTTELIPPLINVATMLMGIALVGKLGKTLADVAFKKPKPKKERPLIYGPKGELLPQNKLPTFKGYTVDYRLREFRKAKYPGALEFISFDSPEGKELLGERKFLPGRHDVEIGTWAERDRMGIWLTDKRTGMTVAEWWDEDAREMFDQGFFKPGDIRQQTITGRAFEESVLDYAESAGLIAGRGKHLPQTVRDAFYWTAINKDTGEIALMGTPYTSSGRALMGGRAFVSRYWKGHTALVEVWDEPSVLQLGRGERPPEIKPAGKKPIASELITAEQPAVIPKEPRQPRPGKEELEFLPDSPEYLAYTIEDIGYRDRIDSAFLQAIARTKGR